MVEAGANGSPVTEIAAPAPLQGDRAELPLGGDRQDRRPEPTGGVPRRARERLATLSLTVEEPPPEIEPRRAAALARRLAPECPSHSADVLPRSRLAAGADATPAGTCSAAS